jgi:hypothetical protein
MTHFSVHAPLGVFAPTEKVMGRCSERQYEMTANDTT